MPGRVARSSTSVSNKPQNARGKKSQKRSLEAFSIASHSAPDKLRIRRHRLGESVNDEPRQKRRRVEDDDDDDDDDDDEAPRKARRGGDHDDVEGGSDSDGNEWRIGGPASDDSDESLDSDEAFGDSDEERFEGFTFRGSSQKKRTSKSKPRRTELDESDGDEDDDEDSDFGDEGVDLATMLDNYSDDQDEAPAKPKKSKKAVDPDQDHDMSASDDEDGEDDDEDDDESMEDEDEAPSEAESDDDANPEKLSKLQDLIASLDADPPEKRSANRGPHVAESQNPSSFGLSASQKLKISDLLPTVTDPALRKSLKILSSDKPSKRSGIPGKLDAPLPKRQQDRIDRTAATQKAKETLDRWRDTVVHNRRAEFLQFPLADPNASNPLGKNRMIPTQQEKPQNDLESAIQNILVESGLSSKDNKQPDGEDQLQEFEELKMNKLPIEEVMARRAELRKARELLFREEAKAKRVKKIKSKAYRRVHRKERERAEEREREFREAEGIESDEDEQEKRDRRRAEERMGTKHRDSKWAKGMKKSGRTVWDDDARDSMLELARRNEDLRRRIEGKDVRERNSDDSDLSEDDDDDDDDDDADDEEADRRRLGKQLEKLGAEDQQESKLGNMLFMQRAEAARKAQNDEDIKRLKRDLAGEQSASDDDADTTVGRRIFGPKAKEGAAPKPKAVRPEMEENLASDDEAEAEAEIIVDRPAEKTAAAPSRKPKSFLRSADKVIRDDSDKEEGDDAANEWLSTATKSKKSNKKKSDDKDEELVSTKMASANKKQSQHAVLSAEPKKKGPKQVAAPATEGWTTVPYTAAAGKDDAEASDDDEAENPMVSAKDKQALFHQRAFAGDDVAVDFEAEKAAQVIDEDDKVESNHLPGWGSWAGDALSKSARRQNERRAHNPLHKSVVEGVKAANRKDAKLKNVVISEAQQRKGKKYLASQLPHQFEKREQYERSLRIPVGPEWTTKETFQRNTRPRVVVKQGIVAPMEKPLFG